VLGKIQGKAEKRDRAR